MFVSPREEECTPMRQATLSSFLVGVEEEAVVSSNTSSHNEVTLQMQQQAISKRLEKYKYTTNGNVVL